RPRVARPVHEPPGVLADLGDRQAVAVGPELDRLAAPALELRERGRVHAKALDEGDPATVGRDRELLGPLGAEVLAPRVAVEPDADQHPAVLRAVVEQEHAIGSIAEVRLVAAEAEPDLGRPRRLVAASPRGPTVVTTELDRER